MTVGAAAKILSPGQGIDKLQVHQARLNQFLGQIDQIVEYVKGYYDDVEKMADAIKGLRGTLFEMGRALIAVPDENFWHGLCNNAWPRNLPVPKISTALHGNAQQDGIIATIAALYAEGPESRDFARNLVLARLFLHAYHQPQFSLRRIPRPYLKAYLAYQFEVMPLLRQGDGAQFVHHSETLLQHILEFLEAVDTPDDDRMLAVRMLQHNFGIKHTYGMMTDENMRPLMELRYKVLSHICRKYYQSEPDWTPPLPQPGRKIRLGVFSKTIMCGGETWVLSANIGKLDRSKYEIILFTMAWNAGGYYHDIDYYRNLVNSVDNIVYLGTENGLPDEELKNLIATVRGYDLDIFWHLSTIGLDGFDFHALLFAHRLARVQCSDLGVLNTTTGNPHFRYFINLDPPFPPPQWGNEFTETELDVDGNYVYVHEKWQDKSNRVVTRELLGIPKKAVVYFGGASLPKYNGEFLYAWLEILKNVPESYLVLYPFNPAWGQNQELLVSFHVRLQIACAEAGVDPARVKLVRGLNAAAVGQMLSWGDVFLGSFPFGGPTSMSDGLRAGLCPVAKYGVHSRTCADANIMASAGLKDLALSTVDAYVASAVRFGADPAYRAAVKQRVVKGWTENHPKFFEQTGRSRAAQIDIISAREFGR